MEEIIIEDKIEVLASLLQAQLVKDMFEGVFNNKYIIYWRDSNGKFFNRQNQKRCCW